MSTERLRASDGEREQVAQVLRTAMSEGRLSMSDGEERLASAYAATYRDELTSLVSDLPGGGWHALADTPEARTQTRQFTRCRIVFGAIAAAILVGLWLLSGGGFFWPAIPLAFIALGILRHSQGHRHRPHGWHGYAPPRWARR